MSGRASVATSDEEPFAAEPERGGCLKLGWGCLPVLLVGFGVLPLTMF
jgi:hypothetical protein